MSKLKRLPSWFFEDELKKIRQRIRPQEEEEEEYYDWRDFEDDDTVDDDDIFLDEDDERMILAERVAREMREKEEEANNLKDDLCFYSILVAGAGIIIGSVVVISRLITYPLVKKFADSWDK